MPQNRERVYTLGHLRARGSRKVFPIGESGGVHNKSISDKSSDNEIAGSFVKQIGNVMPTETRDNPNQGRVYDTAGLAPCLNKMEGGGRKPLITEPCDCLTPDRLEKRQNGRRFKEPGEPMFTLTKQDIHGIAQSNRIRRLTPRECMRLQGVPDYITDKLIAARISDTQMYRAAGDAVSVPVVYEIAKKME